MNEKTGKTTQDIISEYKVLITIVVIVILGLISFCVINGYKVKTPGGWFFGKSEDNTQISKDPLGIVGKWDYVVRPLKGEKLLKEDKVQNKFVDAYDELRGNVQIAEISLTCNCYTMPEGLREGAFIAGQKQPNTEQPLKFSEISYTTAPSVSDPYSFKFGVSFGDLPSENDTQGFVRIKEMKKNKDNQTIQMEGIVTYLYKIKNVTESQVWREDVIVFRRK